MCEEDELIPVYGECPSTVSGTHVVEYEGFWIGNEAYIRLPFCAACKFKFYDLTFIPEEYQTEAYLNNLGIPPHPNRDSKKS